MIYRFLHTFNLVTNAFLCWICFASSWSNAQLLSPQPKFHNYTVENGLPSSETYFIHQDRKGFIWICTDRGVSRFDGYQFKNFTTADGLTDNVVFKIYEDHLGRIWFITFNSKLCYFYNNQIVTYKYNDRIAKNGYSFVAAQKSLFVDKKDNLYFTEEFNGLTIIDPSGKIQHRKFKSGLSFHLFEGKTLWTFNQTVQELNERDSMKVYNFTNKLKNNFLTTYEYNGRISLVESKSNRYVLIDEILYNLSTNKKIRKVENAIALAAMDGTLWVGQIKGGVSQFSTQGNYQSISHYLTNYSVTSILKDNEGGYWFSTLEKGIFYTPSLAIKSYSKNEGLIDDEVNSIGGIKDNIYVGYLTGKWQNLKYPKFRNDLKISNTRTIIGNSSNQIFISTKYTYTLEQGKLAKELFNSWSADYYSHKGSIYFGNQGVYKLNEKGKLSVLYNYKNDHSPNKKNLFQTVMVDASQKVWVGCLAGLYYIENQKLSNAGLQNPLFKERVSDLEYHPILKKIVATRGQGVYCFDNSTILKHFTTKDGLVSDIINVLYQDKQNGIWIGTSEGLNYLTVKSNNQIQLETFTTFHGLCSNEITGVYRNGNKVYVATKNGLSVIDLKLFTRNKVSSKINVTHFVAGRSVLNYQHPNLLEPSIDIVKISFRNDNYRTLEEGKYKYRMNKNGDWITTSTPDITLINPLPGPYLLEVKYQNEDGIWSKPQRILYFSIDNEFYKKTYFIISMFLAFAVLLGCSIRFRFRQIKRKHQLNLKFNQLEQRALQAQMNPHFIFNALNSIQSFLVFEENKKAEKYLITFSQLIRQTLINSRDPYITIQNEIELLKKYLELEKMRFRDKFDFQFEIKMEQQTLLQKIPTMLIQPFVENAVIHGFSTIEKEGKLRIMLEKDSENSVKCTVVDNGIGRQKALQLLHKNHVSFATTISEERLLAFEKKHREHFKIETIDLENEDGTTGTKVIINLPLI